MKTGETQNTPTAPPRSLRIFAWLFRLLGVIIAVIASVAAFLVFSPSGYLLSVGLAVVAVLGLVFGWGMGWWMGRKTLVTYDSENDTLFPDDDHYYSQLYKHLPTNIWYRDSD